MKVEYFFYSQPYNSTFDLLRIEISYVLNCLLFEFPDFALGIQVEHIFVDSAELVLDLAAFYLHKKDSHGSLQLACSELVSCYWI